MDIGLSSVFERKELRAALREILPGLDVEVIEDVSELPKSWDLWILLIEGSDEFPTGLMLAVPFLDGVDEELWMRDLSRALSEKLGVKTLFDGTPYGPYESPYWSLIWDDGAPYLADDSEWEEPGEDDPGELRIVKELDLELFPRRSPEDLAACVDRGFQILKRPEAIRRLAEERLPRLSSEQRREQLEIMCCEAWDSDPGWPKLPNDVQREIEERELSEAADSPRYDPVLLLWLRSELRVASNEYLEILLRDEMGQRATVIGEEPVLAACPCCGYASLGSRGNYEICRLCWWEDDGKDNDLAEDEPGGPNGGVTLTQARVNFFRHELYDPQRTDLRKLREPRAKYRQARRFELSDDGKVVRELGAAWSSRSFRL